MNSIFEGFVLGSGRDAMKIIVAVKRVVDANVKIRVKTDGTGVDLANIMMQMMEYGF